ncbi:UNVERIFIED_CONTAM: hypothetical protein NCL1_27636 [Trichonephila clavipes]
MDPPCRRKGAECVVKDNLAYCRCPPGKKFGLLSGLCEEFCTFQTCLNGECEVVKVGNVAVNYKCKCVDGYTGMRCEVKFPGGSIYPTTSGKLIFEKMEKWEIFFLLCAEPLVARSNKRNDYKLSMKAKSSIVSGILWEKYLVPNIANDNR